MLLQVASIHTSSWWGLHSMENNFSICYFNLFKCCFMATTLLGYISCGVTTCADTHTLMILPEVASCIKSAKQTKTFFLWQILRTISLLKLETINIWKAMIVVEKMHYKPKYSNVYVWLQYYFPPQFAVSRQSRICMCVKSFANLIMKLAPLSSIYKSQI